MSKKTVQVEVSEYTYNLVQAGAIFCKEAYNAAKDGFQPFKDVPVMLQSAMVNLVPQMGHVDEVAAEFVAEPIDSVYAALLALKPLVKELGGKSVVAAIAAKK